MKRLIAALSVAAVALAAMFMAQPSRNGVPDARLTVGVFPRTEATLIYLAHERDLFRDFGLDVELREFLHGGAAVDAMLRGEVDVAIATDFVFAERAFETDDLQVIATIGSFATFETLDLVAPVASEIRTPFDLRGARVRIGAGTLTDYLLTRLLQHHGIDRAAVEAVDILLAETAEALEAGRVDAALVAPPYDERIRNSIETRTLTLRGRYPSFTSIAIGARQQTLKNHQRAIRALLSGLREAHLSLTANPTRLQRFLIDRLGYSTTTARRDLSRYRIKLWLPQHLVDILDDQARWISEQSDTPQIDVLRLIDTEPLRHVSPESVGVIE